MIILCAWCEREGRPAFIRDTDPTNRLLLPDQLPPRAFVSPPKGLS